MCGGGLPREGVVLEKFVPSLESLFCLDFKERESGTSQNFCWDVPRPLDVFPKSCKTVWRLEMRCKRVEESRGKSCKVVESRGKSCKIVESRGKSWKVMGSHGQSLKMVENQRNSPGKGVHGARVFCRKLARYVFKKFVEIIIVLILRPLIQNDSSTGSSCCQLALSSLRIGHSHDFREREVVQHIAET